MPPMLNRITRRLAAVAFYTGLVALVMFPHAVIVTLAAIFNLAQCIAGKHEELSFIEAEVQFMGILYCAGLPVWIGYSRVARKRFTRKRLRKFWLLAFLVNAIWVIYLIAVPVLSDLFAGWTDAWIWWLFLIVPAIHLPVTWCGYRISARKTPLAC